MHALPFLLAFALAAVASAQPISGDADGAVHYTVPFGAAGNGLELSVANGSAGAQTATVSLAGAPPWVRVRPAEVQLGEVHSGEEAVAAFRFDLDADAPVGEAAAIVFTVATGTGGAVQKEVWIEAAPPASFRLVGAYPNPLGGSAGARATIAYELPEAAEASLSVYDVLGRRVAIVGGGPQEAGRREVIWEAAGVASGLYLWELVVGSAGDARHVEWGKLTVTR